MKSNSGNRVYRYLFVAFALIATTATFTNCKKWTQKNTDAEISKHGDDEGHKKGQNCMNCHYTEGEGDGAFSLGGSVYGNPGDGMVYLYTDWNLPPVDSVEIDADGNVYTTEAIDFGDGYHVSVKSGSGAVKQMTDKITNGQCNLCHGVTTTQISF